MKWYFEENERIKRLMENLPRLPGEQILEHLEKFRKLTEPPEAQILRELKKYKNLTEPPQLRILQEVEKYRQLTEPPGLRALRDLQDRTGSEARQTQEVMSGFMASLLAQYRHLTSIQETLGYSSRVTTDLRKSFELASSPIPFFASVAAQLQSATSLEALSRFQESFAGQLLERLNKAAQSQDDEVEEHVEAVAELIEQGVERAKGGSVSFEGYVQIILAVLLFLAQWIATEKSERKFTARLDSIDQRLKDAAAVVAKQDRSSRLRLVTADRLRVREAPSKEARVLTRLTANALVRITNEKKNWAEVEYFDFVSGSTRNGWVAKRFLRELPEDLGE